MEKGCFSFQKMIICDRFKPNLTKWSTALFIFSFLITGNVFAQSNALKLERAVNDLAQHAKFLEYLDAQKDLEAFRNSDQFDINEWDFEKLQQEATSVEDLIQKIRTSGNKGAAALATKFERSQNATMALLNTITFYGFTTQEEIAELLQRATEKAEAARKNKN